MNKLTAFAMALCLVPLVGSPSQALPVGQMSPSADVLLVRDGCGYGYGLNRYGECRPQPYRSPEYSMGNGYSIHYECPRGFRYSMRSGRCRPLN